MLPTLAILCLLTAPPAGRAAALPAAAAISPASPSSAAVAAPAPAVLAPAPDAASRSPVPLTAAQASLARVLGNELRCPVCQGMPIGEAPSPMARAMMRRVQEMVASGETPDAIRAHFVARYGEWVLLDPRAEGFGWLVWGLPPLLLLLSSIVLWRLGRRPRSAATATAAECTVAAKTLAENPLLAAIRAEVHR